MAEALVSLGHQPDEAWQRSVLQHVQQQLGAFGAVELMSLVEALAQLGGVGRQQLMEQLQVGRE